MKKLLFLVCSVLLVGFACYAQDYSGQKAITKKVIEYFEKGETSEIYALFDDTMKSSITAEKLTEIWNTLPSQVGNYLGSGEAIVSEAQGYVIVNHFLDFENTDLDLKLVFNYQNQISGLFFFPH